jgi:hypothetical protein
MSKKTLFLLGLVVLVSSALSFSLLTRGQLWWDDFAAYIMQAQSLLNGTMDAFAQRNAFTVLASTYPPGPITYPWGFPLLIAPVYALLGLNLLAFKLVNTLFYALFLLIFFQLARTRLADLDALVLTAVLAFNPVLLLAHDLIQADITFLFFSTLEIFLIDKLSRQKPAWGTDVATGAIIFMAFFIRANGILLLIPLLVSALMVTWPRWQVALRQIARPTLTFGILLIIQMLLFPGGQESYFSHFSMFSLPGLWSNVLYYFWLPAELFNKNPGGGTWIYLLLLVFLVVSLIRRREREAAMHVYSLATLGLFILWPERQGLRFIYPILPFLLLCAYDGMQISVEYLKVNWHKIGSRIIPVWWSSLALVSLVVAFGFASSNLAAKRDINGPFDPISNQMFVFVRDKTPKDSVIIFYKPRVLRLLTDRDAFMTARCADLSKGNYVVISKKISGEQQIPPEQVTTCNPAVKVDEVFTNKRFVVYKILQ